MNWGIPDAALQLQVRERQRITIENYANDPDLLAEHVGMEDNFQAGGYGERQIEELLQNAIDQLNGPGRVELRLVGGVLYCANEGNVFDAEGVKAIAGAFLSSKKDDKIGRFGLGFKSVLGVSHHPQIFSRSISFGFNEPEASALLAGLAYRPERVPTLRVPSLVDANEVAREDQNLAEMMEWASTVIRLPLVRGGDRLRNRLLEFDGRYLLFPEDLARVDISLESRGGGVETSSFLRESIDAGIVVLESPDGQSAEWRVIRRDHQVSDEVSANLPGLFRRKSVTVSYALERGKSGVGEFWAWFPLLDRTTASGIFNAPWQVNDDRTSLLPGSALNRELLDVAAELLIDSALLESTPEDPAKHFDVLPARGRETRSNADKYMSERIPQLARRHMLIPTSEGTMRAPGRVRAPYLTGQANPFALPAEAVRRWAESMGTDDTPHWTCYSTATRAARLEQLLTNEDESIACLTIPPATWLSQLAQIRTLDSVDAALSIFIRLDENRDVVRQFAEAQIIPLRDGEFARASRASTVLLPVEGKISPDGVNLVADEYASDATIRSKLLQIGVGELSPDQVVMAAAAEVTAQSSTTDWGRFWSLLAEASPSAGRSALLGLRERHVNVLVPTRAGSWRSAVETFGDSSWVPGLPARQVDLGAIAGRSDLLESAGVLSGISSDFPIQNDPAFEKYRRAMQAEVNGTIAQDYGSDIRGILEFPELSGAGPLSVLMELKELGDPAVHSALARLSKRVLELMRFARLTVPIDFKGKAKQGAVTLNGPEIWAVQAFGMLESSLGPVRPGMVAGPGLRAYSEFIAVSPESLSGVWELPGELTRLPQTVLSAFLSRDQYSVNNLPAFAELLAACANRKSFSRLSDLPAIDPTTGTVVLTPIQDVVIASPEELDDLRLHRLRYIPSGDSDQSILAAWHVRRAADVVAQALDWSVDGEAIPLTDVYPTLEQSVTGSVADVWLQRCGWITRRTTSPSGVRETRLSGYLNGRMILLDDELDQVDALLKVSELLHLGLRRDDALLLVSKDEALRKNDLVQRVVSEPSEPAKLLALVGRARLAENLPLGLLEIIEQRQGPQGDSAVAELFLNTYGQDSLRKLKDALADVGMTPPRTWDGTPDAERFVTRFGFPRIYAGTREKKAAAVDLVPGKVRLEPLHEFQIALRDQIRELALIRDKDGSHRRGLLYLPTGAGKTRVTTESIVAMLRDDELASPVLWIAQSEELCEQAILSWTEVWRAIGDERPLEITRYWGNYEADESLQELQIVVATDDKLASMIDRDGEEHGWLREARMVVIDEAHTAGSPTYTKILRWLGIANYAAGARTDRPLLGLTATPYRGSNPEVNRQFVQRFGERRLNALDKDHPIEELREMQVLSTVDHELLDGILVTDSPTDGQSGQRSWDDVSRTILTKIGDNLDRTQLLVDHIMTQSSDWPILVFTPSVVSAHVCAALLRSLGRAADAVDGGMRGQERRRKIDAFKSGDTKVLVNCDLLTQGFDAPKVRALYIARPTFSPNRYVQMVGRGLRGPLNGGTERCLVVNMVDTFTQFDKELAFEQFDYLWKKSVRTG